MSIGDRLDAASTPCCLGCGLDNGNAGGKECI